MNKMLRVISATATATAVIVALLSLPNIVQATEQPTGQYVGKLAAMAEICGYRSRAEEIQSKYSILPKFNDSYRYWRNYWGKYDIVRGPCGQIKDLADELIDLDVPTDLGAGQEAFSKGDYAASFKQWLPLAEQGDAVAQANVGYLYHTGQGVPQDYAEALKWYLKAAEQGKTDAQFNLGNMYKNGEGVPADWVTALMWYKLAAKQGYEPAQENRDWLAARMTEADIARAERLAQEWPEKPVAAAVGETECLSCESSDEQATAPLLNFDGKWIFEIADVDNPSATDRETVEIKNNRFTVEVSTNGWRGRLAGEIDSYGRLVGQGTLSRMGLVSDNITIHFASDYRSSGFQEEVRARARYPLFFRINLTKDKLEASSELSEQQKAALPATQDEMDGEWVLEIREPDFMPAGDKVTVDIVDGRFTANISANGWSGVVSGRIDRHGLLVASGSLRKQPQFYAMLKWSSEPSGGQYSARVPTLNHWLSMAFEVSLHRRTSTVNLTNGPSLAN